MLFDLPNQMSSELPWQTLQVTQEFSFYNIASEASNLSKRRFYPSGAENVESRRIARNERPQNFEAFHLNQNLPHAKFQPPSFKKLCHYTPYRMRNKRMKEFNKYSMRNQFSVAKRKESTFRRGCETIPRHCCALINQNKPRSCQESLIDFVLFFTQNAPVPSGNPCQVRHKSVSSIYSFSLESNEIFRAIMDAIHENLEDVKHTKEELQQCFK